MFRIKKSIFTKLLTTYLALMMTLLLIIALLLSWGYNNYVFKQKQDELRSAAVQTASRVESYQNNEIPYSELSHSLDILSSLTGSRIYAIKYSQASLQERNVILDQEVVDSYLIQDLKAILQGEEVYRQKQYSDKFDTHVVFAGIPLENQVGHIEGAVLLFAPINEINANIARINMIIWISALIALIISGVIIYSVSRKISRPLKAMEEGARKIAEGDQIEDLDFHSGDELDLMANAFNHMKNRILSVENMRREFIASVSHDLKTPLTTINGFVQGMLDGIVKPENYDKYLRVIREETKRLIALTSDILEHAKMQSGTIHLSRKYLFLKDLIEKLLENTGVKDNGKRIRIEIDCPQTIEIYADEERLKQIILNILDNALKFTKENGEILISATETLEKVTIMIKDNGQGIVPEDLPLIFEKFYRGDKSRQGTTGGTGLGLNIAKMLVELHGGTITAYSELGKGTEVRLIFPK